MKRKVYVTRTQVTIYEAWADSQERALEMIKRHEWRPVGSPTEEGYGTFSFFPALEVWSASEHAPELTKEHPHGN